MGCLQFIAFAGLSAKFPGCRAVWIVPNEAHVVAADLLVFKSDLAAEFPGRKVVFAERCSVGRHSNLLKNEKGPHKAVLLEFCFYL
jgi:hypothetical protein